MDAPGHHRRSDLVVSLFMRNVTCRPKMFAAYCSFSIRAAMSGMRRTLYVASAHFRIHSGSSGQEYFGVLLGAHRSLAWIALQTDLRRNVSGRWTLLRERGDSDSCTNDGAQQTTGIHDFGRRSKPCSISVV